MWPVSGPNNWTYRWIGGAQAEYRIEVNPARLASFNLSRDQVAQAISAANVITAVGRLEENYKLYLIVSDTSFSSLDEIRLTVLRSGKNGLVRLDDIAAVTRATAPQWTRVTADGHDAVLFQVYQQPGGNTVEIARDIKDQLSGSRSHLPPGIKVANWYDQSQLILASAGSVRDAILIGVCCAVLVLWLFLRNARMTLIAAVIVPFLVFALLLFLYETFFGALAILCTTLTALSAVFIGLWLTSTELNISSKISPM